MEDEIYPDLYDRDMTIPQERTQESETVSKAGVAERCMRCGNCCTYKVELSHKDIDRISHVTELNPEDFVIATYGSRNWIDAIRRIDDPIRKKSYCMFIRWKDKTISYCSIYENRPHICRSFPTSSEYKDACPNGFEQGGIANTISYLVRCVSNLF
jgi:Fe-S-cluster containining protein